MYNSATSLSGCPPPKSCTTTKPKPVNPCAPKKEPKNDQLQMLETLMECLCCFITQSSEILQTLKTSLEEETGGAESSPCLEMVQLLSEALCEFIPKSSDVLGKLKDALCGKMVSLKDTKDKGCNCESKPNLNRRKSDLAKTKMMSDKMKAEKIEKLSQIKTTMCATQQTLQCIQEQIRQLERMEVDFNSCSTADGQVNPAALYKEIMKPEPVPYSPVKSARKNPCTPPPNPCATPPANPCAPPRPNPCPPPRANPCPPPRANPCAPPPTPCPHLQQIETTKLKCDFIYEGTIAKPKSKSNKCGDTSPAPSGCVCPPELPMTPPLTPRHSGCPPMTPRHSTCPPPKPPQERVSVLSARPYKQC